jgi:hypothetical protein
MGSDRVLVVLVPAQRVAMDLDRKQNRLNLVQVQAVVERRATGTIASLASGFSTLYLP